MQRGGLYHIGFSRLWIDAGRLASAVFFLSGGAEAACWGVDAGQIDAKFNEAASLCGSPRAEGPAPAAQPSFVQASQPQSPLVVTIRMAGRMAESLPAASPVRGAPGAARTGRLDGLIRDVAQRYRINPRLLASIVTAESRGRSDAVSPRGALGLMQVMPGTAREMGVADPVRLLGDEQLSLATGARYLKHLQARFGNNVPLVVAAYNAGPGAVVKAGLRVPGYQETQGYVSSVMSHFLGAGR